MRMISIACLGLAWACSGPVTDTDTDTGTSTDSATSGDTGKTPVDVDGDGFDVASDCDDGDASVNPDAEEVCDGIDNDCDKVIDDVGGATIAGVNFRTLQDALDHVGKKGVFEVDVCPSKDLHFIQPLSVGDGLDLTIRGTGGRDFTRVEEGAPGPVSWTFQVTAGGRLALDAVTITAGSEPTISVEGPGRIELLASAIRSGTRGIGVVNLASKLPAVLRVIDTVVVDVRGGVSRAISLDGVFDAVVRRCLFENNGGENSDGAAVSAVGLGPIGGNLRIENSEFVGNSGDDGGALHASAITVTASNTVFRENSAAVRGGGVSLVNGATFDGMGTTTLSNNTVGSDGLGGAIFVGDGSVSGVTLVANEASSGGGLAVQRDDDTKTPLTLADVTFIGNLASVGGGVYVGPFTELVLAESCTLDGNEAVSGGGAYLAGLGSALESHGATWANKKSVNTPDDVAFGSGGSVTFTTPTPNVRCTNADQDCTPL